MHAWLYADTINAGHAQTSCLDFTHRRSGRDQTRDKCTHRRRYGNCNRARANTHGRALPRRATLSSTRYQNLKISRLLLTALAWVLGRPCAHNIEFIARTSREVTPRLVHASQLNSLFAQGGLRGRSVSQKSNPSKGSGLLGRLPLDTRASKFVEFSCVAFCVNLAPRTSAGSARARRRPPAHVVVCP